MTLTDYVSVCPHRLHGRATPAPHSRALGLLDERTGVNSQLGELGGRRKAPTRGRVARSLGKEENRVMGGVSNISEAGIARTLISR